MNIFIYKEYKDNRVKTVKFIFKRYHDLNIDTHYRFIQHMFILVYIDIKNFLINLNATS